MPEADASDPHALYHAANAADEAWSAELVKAFGKDACNRRYDMDTSGHPPAAVEAKAKRHAAVNRWLVTLRVARGETA